MVSRLIVVSNRVAVPTSGKSPAAGGLAVGVKAALTGHLVLSTLHTTDAVKTVERLIGMFPKSQEHIIRMRLAGAFRFIVSQRLIPKADGRGRVAAIARYYDV